MFRYELRKRERRSAGEKFTDTLGTSGLFDEHVADATQGDDTRLVAVVTESNSAPAKRRKLQASSS